MSNNFNDQKWLAIVCLLTINMIACDDKVSSTGGSDLVVVMRAGAEAEAGTMTAGDTTLPINTNAFLERLTIDDVARGPAFTTLADMNNDGKLDLIVSEIGPVDGLTIEPGELNIYYQGDSLEDWRVEPVSSMENPLYWPNSVEVYDIDNDGDLDLTVGTGFLLCEVLSRVDAAGEMTAPSPCGNLLWYEQADGQWIRHDIVEPDSELFYHHGLLADLDGDGIEDLISVGERRYLDAEELVDIAETQWFKGQVMGARFDPTPRVIGPGMGSLAELHDLDGDGDIDIVSAEYYAEFEQKSFAWYEQVEAPNANSNGVWERHVIDDQVGPAIYFSLIDDLYGDGNLVAIGSNHTQTTGDDPEPWESAVYVYEIPQDLRSPWTNRSKVSENIVSIGRSNQAAPGIFGVGDINGDSRKDILVSGDGDSRVFALIQNEDQSFATWVLDEDLPQAGSMKVSDLNGDGNQEIVVSSYDQNVIYLYRRSDNGQYPLRPAEIPSWANGGEMMSGTEMMAGMEIPAGDMGGATGGELIPIESDLAITYSGSATGPLVVAAFSSWPPLGPPSAFEQDPNPSFPVSISFPQLAAGTYTILAFIDVDGSGPMQPSEDDVQVQVEIPFPTNSTVEVNLEGQGPEPVEGLEIINESLSRGMRVTPITAMIPQGNGTLPMIVFTPGFQLQSSYYAPMLEALAQEGYIVVLADPPGTLFDVNHIEMAADVRSVIDWTLMSSFSTRIDESKIATMGHSLGGKIALFNAAEDSRVIATLALDPVDGDPSPFPDPSTRPTLAESVLGQVTGAVGLIGELSNTEPNGFAPACAPSENNFQTIYTALTNASWLVEWELVGADHMDFVSSCPGGFLSPCDACQEGTMAPDRVISLSTDFAKAFFALHLRGESAREAELTSAPGSDVNVRQP